MGMFLSFLGGAATGLTEEIDKSEKEAKAYASMATKALYENYGKTVEANRKLESEMKSDRDFIVANKPDATPDQVQALLSNPEVMKKYKAYANPTDVNLDTLIKITKANPSVAVAAENVEAFPAIQSKAKEVLNTIQKSKGRTGLGGMIDSIAERSGNTAAVQTANALGVSLEELQRTKLKGRPTSDATFDMTVFKEPDTIDKRLDKALLAVDDAKKSNDPKALADATLAAQRIKNSKDVIKPLTYAENVDAVKNAFSYGTPEQKAAAKPAYDEWLRRSKEEAQAKHIKEDDGTPKIGTLINVAKTAMATAINDKYGEKLGKGISIVPDAYGGVTVVNTLSNKADRDAVNATGREAVKKALAGYKSSNDVNVVMGIFAPTYIPQDGSLPTEPAVPSPSLVTRPTTPAPAQPIKPAPVAAPAPVPAAQPATKLDANAARAEANAAIGKGANRAAVAAEFKKQTGQDL